VAFQPQISYEAAMINNDILAITLHSAMLWGLVVALRRGFDNRLCVALGVALGLGLLTKATALTILPIAGAAIVLAFGWRPRSWLRPASLIGLPALALAAPWYFWLFRSYGNLSGFAQIKELQQAWNWPEGTFFELLYRIDFVAMRFSETWGEFGWRRLPLGSTLLDVIGVSVGAAAVGLLIYVVVPPRRDVLDRDPLAQLAGWQIAALWLLVLTCAVSYLAVVQFGTTFALTQARYFFSAVNAAALLLMLGLRTLIPLRWRPYGAAATLLAMAALHGVIFARYIIPFYPQW
jgi:4-amino-4-deoxy-L-arabinose transferase-like glycosyltransferase